MSIIIKNLYFKYQGEEDFILKDINLSINEGECVGIIGSNGAGKTTLIKHLNGILKPTFGDVYIYGMNTKKYSVAELSRIVGIIFQNPDHQIFANSVFEEVAFALRNFGFKEEDIKKIVKEMLKNFSLEKYENISPLLLSGGEKKRVTIASVLVYNPKIIIFDEPTIGLDFFQKVNLKNIINMLKENKKTIIVVSHDVDFIFDLCERVIVMANGKIIKDGSSFDVFYDEETLEKANLFPPLEIKISKILNIKERVLNIEELAYKIKDYLNVKI